MKTSIKRRVLGALTLVLATQALSACVVVPVPAHHPRPIVVEPGYAYPAPPPPYPYRGPYWRR